MYVPLCRPVNVEPPHYWPGNQLACGKYTEELEATAAEYLGVASAVYVKSCTVGMQCVLRALSPTYAPPWGLSAACPSFTWRATASAIVNGMGCRPHLMDCDPEDFTVLYDPDPFFYDYLVAVNVFGIPPAAPKGATTWIVDAAHGFGGSLLRPSDWDRPPEAWVFSFSPTKLFTGDGSGGLIATNDEALAEECRQLRYYGSKTRDGFNGWATERSAAHALAGLECVDELLKGRSWEVAARYRGEFFLHPEIQLQAIPEGVESAWKDFAILVQNPDELRMFLQTKGIETRRYFNPPLHCLSGYNKREETFPNTDDIVSRVLCLPIWAEMKPKQCQYVIDNVLRYFDENNL